MIAAVLEPLTRSITRRGVVVAERDPGVARAGVHGAPARQLGDQQLAAVADDVRVEVLERGRVGVDAGDVHPALVGERVAAHVRLVGVGREVEQLIEEVGGRGQRRQLLGAHALVAQLELQVGDDRDQVGVAAALAVAVDRPLDVAWRPARTAASEQATPQPASSWQWIPTRTPVGAERRHHRGHRCGDRVGQRAAVGVAADAPSRRRASTAARRQASA